MSGRWILTVFIIDSVIDLYSFLFYSNANNSCDFSGAKTEKESFI